MYWGEGHKFVGPHILTVDVFAQFHRGVVALRNGHTPHLTACASQAHVHERTDGSRNTVGLHLWRASARRRLGRPEGSWQDALFAKGAEPAQGRPGTDAKEGLNQTHFREKAVGSARKDAERCVDRSE